MNTDKYFELLESVKKKGVGPVKVLSKLKAEARKSAPKLSASKATIASAHRLAKKDPGYNTQPPETWKQMGVRYAKAATRGGIVGGVLGMLGPNPAASAAKWAGANVALHAGHDAWKWANKESECKEVSEGLARKASDRAGVKTIGAATDSMFLSPGKAYSDKLKLANKKSLQQMRFRKYADKKAGYKESACVEIADTAGSQFNIAAGAANKAAAMSNLWKKTGEGKYLNKSQRASVLADRVKAKYRKQLSK